MTRLRRALELSRFYGFFSREVLRTIFPPFKGWDVGCRPCKHCPAAQLAKRCARGDRLGFRQCGEGER